MKDETTFNVTLKINVEWLEPIQKAMKVYETDDMQFFMNDWMNTWFDNDICGTGDGTLEDELKAFAEYRKQLKAENAVYEFRELGYKSNMMYNGPGRRVITGNYITVSIRATDDNEPLMKNLNVALVRQVMANNKKTIISRIYNDKTEKCTVKGEKYYYRRIRFSV